MITVLPGSDMLPAEVVAWYRTPVRRDQYAADLFEWCRWLNLPAAERSDATRDWLGILNCKSPRFEANCYRLHCGAVTAYNDPMAKAAGGR